MRVLRTICLVCLAALSLQLNGLRAAGAATYNYTAAVAAGAAHSFILDNGNVLGFGFDADGRLGTGLTPSQARTTPTFVQGLHANDVAAISTGHWGNHALALRKDGTVVAWGLNDHGQLGNSTASTTWTTTPQPVPGLTNIVAIEAGYSKSFAIDASGALWVWGLNDYGGLGLGDTVDRYSPTAIPTLRFTSVSSGHYHTIALDNDGRVWSWGYNDRGELSTWTTATSRTIPASSRPRCP